MMASILRIYRMVILTNCLFELMTGSKVAGNCFTIHRVTINTRSAGTVPPGTRHRIILRKYGITFGLSCNVPGNVDEGFTSHNKCPRFDYLSRTS